MKIRVTFFRSKLDLLCISKVLTIFCVFSKIRWKRKHSRGHVAGSPSARGDSSVWALGRAAHSESTREGFSRLGHAGHVAGSGASGVAPGESVLGTRVLLGGLPDVACGLGTRGQVACSEASGGSLPAKVLGTRVALGVFRGKYHSLDSRRTRGLPGGSVVNGYSGHVATRATAGETLPFVILGTRGALAGFRGKYHSLDVTLHGRASGRLRGARGLPGKVVLVRLAAH